MPTWLGYLLAFAALLVLAPLVGWLGHKHGRSIKGGVALASLMLGMGAMFGGVSGVMFASFQGFVSPESFSLAESVMVVAMAVTLPTGATSLSLTFVGNQIIGTYLFSSSLNQANRNIYRIEYADNASFPFGFQVATGTLARSGR